jgi:hypothetical protein
MNFGWCISPEPLHTFVPLRTRLSFANTLTDRGISNFPRCPTTILVSLRAMFNLLFL